MTDRSEQEFEVVVRPGFPIMMACLVAVYTFFHVIASLRLGIEVPLAESLNWGAAVTVLILLGTLLHELGHVLAGLAAGHRWTGAVLNGAGLGVVIEPEPHGWHRVARSAAGPVMHLLFSVPLLAVAVAGTPAGPFDLPLAQTSLWWVAGVSSLFLAVLNALPIPGFDGAKVVVGVREVLGAQPRRAPAPIAHEVVET